MSNVVPGYNGKILRVNLTTKSVLTEEIDEQVCRQYLGGAGFIAYYLWKELKPGVDALSPDNKLIFALGPASGLVLPGASRNCIGAKSPLAGGIAKSEVGGYWMVELKRAGFDAVIVEGKADSPVYVWIQDGNVSIRDASHLWGKETLETETAIRSELGDDHVQVAFIGPGGENLVRFACIMEGCHDAAGRGGLGAVMGSKNLKAIAVRGHNAPQIFNPDKIKEIRQQLTHPSPISEFGTGGPYMLNQEATGDLPIRNFRDGGFPEVKLIHGGAIKETVRIGMEGCFACPLRCKKVVKFEEPYKVDPAYGGPEYETLASLGSNCGISDLKAILKGNERCNAYSLDTISAGSAISFAIECFENGLLTREDTGGLELKWGDGEIMLKLLEMITRREGIGDFIAEGTARMAQKIGQKCHDFALHVKGLEPGMHEPRIGSALFLGFMLSPNGADHCAATPDGLLANDMMFKPFHPLGWMQAPAPEEISSRKVGIFKDSQLINILCDSMVVCQFPGITIEQAAELIKGITGWDTGISELMRIAERITTVMRLINLREGLSSADDKLPERFYQPTNGGPLANVQVDREGYEKARK
ncbi:MAG: aldehyde ferredoxin oxidoreductase family protein, partial [Dehalococcoidales bacterium]|nr:aldehyde ferredoxin oxidoreductase family protein [Dehalococcoidales bacterium]